MRIQSVDPSGNVTAQFLSIQAAGRAGYSLQRVHACLHGKAKSHRGLTWRRVDGLHSLPLFAAARIVRTPHKSLPADAAFNAFLDWLPPEERDIDRRAFAAELHGILDSYSPVSQTFGAAELRAA